jgi:alkylation response protein AidB-like acyl-CoA dehydrogenase
MDRALLNTVWQLADEFLRPQAALADQSDVRGPVADNIDKLGTAGLFGLGIAPEYGGLGSDEVTRHEYTELLASACGVTAFTQQQLQVGIKFVTEADNHPLKKQLLPELAAGRLYCGIALSHLRRAGLPAVCAVAVPGGYCVNGAIPWITGWTLLDSFVLGAALEDGSHLFAYIDKPHQQAALTVSNPLDLIVMAASDTVEVEVHGLFIPEEFVLSCRPAAELARADYRTLTTHAALPLGCARGCAARLRELAQKPGRESLNETAFALTLEIDSCRREALTWNCDCVAHAEYKTYALRARAGANILALRAAHALVVATGGSAHLRSAAPQRLLREAQFYSTAVQTPDVQASTLDQLISPYFGL